MKKEKNNITHLINIKEEKKKEKFNNEKYECFDITKKLEELISYKI
jgi:hypothetical protein